MNIAAKQQIALNNKLYTMSTIIKVADWKKDATQKTIDRVMGWLNDPNKLSHKPTQFIYDCFAQGMTENEVDAAWEEYAGTN